MADNKDEYIRALDFLERGTGGGQDEPTVQGIGTQNFNLLEVVVKDGERPRGGTELYIGEGDRDKVDYIKQRISFDDLTASAQSELEYVLKAIVDEEEERFVEFFNNATPVTPRRHAFEFLPGVGTKMRDRLIDERESEEFESYEDINDRLSSMRDVQKLIADRVLNELRGDAKKRLFT
jgi:Predicted RNA-binding protein